MTSSTTGIRRNKSNAIEPAVVIKVKANICFLQFGRCSSNTNIFGHSSFDWSSGIAPITEWFTGKITRPLEIPVGMFNKALRKDCSALLVPLVVSIIGVIALPSEFPLE